MDIFGLYDTTGRELSGGSKDVNETVNIWNSVAVVVCLVVHSNKKSEGSNELVLCFWILLTFSILV
jgi:hypothetical protein